MDSEEFGSTDKAPGLDVLVYQAFLIASNYTLCT